jgi:hypothetical protein
VRSGVQIFSLSFTIAPFAIVSGIITAITKRYWFQNVFGWSLAGIGLGLMILLDYGASTWVWIVRRVSVFIHLTCMQTVI